MSEKELDINAIAEDVEDISLEEEKATPEEEVKLVNEQMEEEEVNPETKNDAEEDSAPPLPARKPTPELASEVQDINPLFRQLKDAFPSIEDVYINTVLIASQGDMDKSFNAMLYLSDPKDSGITVPSTPLSKSSTRKDNRSAMSQYEQDELLARQLSEKFNSSKTGRKYERDEQQRSDQRRRERQRRQNSQLTAAERREYYDEGDDSWSQFLEKDLPEIKDMANKQIQETAQKLNNWFGGVKKNLSNMSDEYGNPDSYYDEDVRRTAGGNAQRPQSKERFNSFGARVGDDSLERHGISLRTDDGYEDIPPQLPTRTRTKDSFENKGSVTPEPKKNVVAQTTYIDTPENKKYQAITPEPIPGKIQMNVNPDDDDFLINSDDEI
ncbi:hypothetical protein TPHA_0C00260 [Tetrapisispora phaffii CBS 4417]|uniref:CUE domain-containing protein n=1 Tax=Tetrapisispora phaffii (strain ATCC 24235 / CBS 4417 / NBRC 1672 / NRRL Y-8282 / UCD 70-5) TaxID=1071381 RepID=G8BR07_TETPH|nr:hypothetical protein TPHA_0C00260 [Tetrapisispora phaffii CBS 4417]CCE62183.1 hypothetical protein TPHA_0C00260 [Tetrapisispora phaffii CBS 4417]